MSEPFSTNERGLTATYVLLLLPLLLSLAAVATDFSEWSAYKSSLRQAADSIAADAVRALPDYQRANDLSVQLAQRSFGAEVAVASLLRGPEFELTLRSNYQPKLLNLLTLLLPGVPDHIQITAKSAAQLQPLDMVLVIADGRTLRPGLRQPTPGTWAFDDAWGSSSDWPASDYFACSEPPLLSGENVIGPWSQLWSGQASRRWLTQSCFNPAFSAVKKAALNVIQSLRGHAGHRLGLVFSPGSHSGRGVSVARHLRGALASETGELLPGRPGGFFGMQRAEALWNADVDPISLSSNALCHHLSDQVLSNPYVFSLDDSKSCVSAFERNTCGERYSPTLSLSSCYAEEDLRLEESVYWQAAKLTESFAFNSALEAAAQEILHQPSLDYAHAERLVRGNAANYPRRNILVVTDYLPLAELSSARTAELLGILEANKIELDVVLFAHPYLSASSRQQLLASRQELERVRTGVSQLQASVTLVSTPADLQRVVGSVISTGNSQILLRR